MKLSVISLASALAFFSHVLATPAPQGGLPVFICGGPDNLKCPTGYRCCIGPVRVDFEQTGTCELPGRVCPL